MLRFFFGSNKEVKPVEFKPILAIGELHWNFLISPDDNAAEDEREIQGAVLGGSMTNLAYCLHHLFAPHFPKDPVPSAPILVDSALSNEPPLSAELSWKERKVENPVKLVTQVRNGGLGTDAYIRLVKAGMSDMFIRRISGAPTGTAYIQLNDAGEVQSYDIEPDASFDFIGHSSHLPQFAPTCSLMCLGSLSLRHQGAKNVIHAATMNSPVVPKYVDLNIRESSHRTIDEKDLFPLEDAVQYLLLHATHLKVNLEEARFVSQMLGLDAEENPEVFIQKISEKYKQLEIAIVTCGARGAFAGNAVDGAIHEPAFEIQQMTNTLGAGDAFSAGFIYGMQTGLSLQRCLRLGNVLGALAVEQREALLQVSPDEVNRAFNRRTQKLEPELEQPLTPLFPATDLKPNDSRSQGKNLSP